MPVVRSSRPAPARGPAARQGARLLLDVLTPRRLSRGRAAERGPPDPGLAAEVRAAVIKSAARCGDTQIRYATAATIPAAQGRLRDKAA